MALTYTIDTDGSACVSPPIWSTEVEYNVGPEEKRIGKFKGTLTKHKITKTPNFIKKLIFINKISLPDDIVNEIKDFLFVSAEFILHKELHSLNCYDINSSTIERSVLIGKTDKIEYEWKINCTFNGRKHDEINNSYLICSQCGNYSSDELYAEISNVSLCEITHPYRTSSLGVVL